MADTKKHFISLDNFKTFIDTLTTSFCAPFALKDHKGNRIADTYAPKTGAGTSGTWPISVSGNAATASNISNATISTTSLVQNGAPVAGADTVTDDIPIATAKRRSYVGSLCKGSIWQGIVSWRHRNGASDGANYGGYIASQLTGSEQNLKWNRQYAANTWQGERTLLDSSNYAAQISPKFVAKTDNITDAELTAALKSIAGSATEQQTPVTSQELQGLLDSIDNSKTNVLTA